MKIARRSLKHYSSGALKSFSLSLMAWPVAYIAFSGLIFNIPLRHCLEILVLPSYHLIGALAILTGYGFWEMRRWAWHLFLGLQVFVLGENTYILTNYADSHHKMLVFCLAIGLQAALLYRVHREIRVPYFFPRIRWWESNPRYRLSVPTQLGRADSASPSGAEVAAASPADYGSGEILDVSLAGCFIKTQRIFLGDESVLVQFRLYGIDLRCLGQVVWLAQSTVTHPRGIGIKFVQVGRAQRRALKKIAGRLRKVASHYRRYRYLMGTEEFIRRLESIEHASDLQA